VNAAEDSIPPSQFQNVGKLINGIEVLKFNQKEKGLIKVKQKTSLK
jgi:hypothetical protein